MSKATRPTTLNLNIDEIFPQKFATPEADYDGIDKTSPLRLTQNQTTTHETPHTSNLEVALQTSQDSHQRPPYPLPDSAQIVAYFQPPGGYPMNEIVTEQAYSTQYETMSGLANLATIDQVKITHQTEVLQDNSMLGMDYELIPVRVYDKNRNEIMSMIRPLASNGCCAPKHFNVNAPVGNCIGKIGSESQCCTNDFCIYNSGGKKIIYIEGSMDQSKGDFKIYTYQKDDQIGSISLHQQGLATEYFKDNSFLNVTFPMHIDVRMKALIIAVGISASFKCLCT